MKRLLMFGAGTLAAFVLLSGCEGNEPQADQPTAPAATEAATAGSRPRQADRWYGPQQVRLGQIVYRENCASCHGGMAQGGRNWRERDEDGNFPPPPLNGRGHTWHHPFPMLRRIVTEGGAQNMPAWGDKLSPEEIEAVLAYVMSLWPERVYEVWETQVQNR